MDTAYWNIQMWDTNFQGGIPDFKCQYPTGYCWKFQISCPAICVYICFVCKIATVIRTMKIRLLRNIDNYRYFLNIGYSIFEFKENRNIDNIEIYTVLSKYIRYYRYCANAEAEYHWFSLKLLLRKLTETHCSLSGETKRDFVCFRPNLSHIAMT